MNNHYIPRFYQKQFSNSTKLYLHDLNNGQTIRKDVKNLFCEKDIYPIWLEEKLNKKIEHPFYNLLENKLLKEDKFCLSIEEETIIRKFIQVQCMRFNFEEHIESSHILNLDRNYCLYSLFEDIDKLLSLSYEEILSESPKEETALPFTTLNILSMHMCNNYISFVETSSSNSFVINDIGYVTEQDVDKKKALCTTIAGILAMDFDFMWESVRFPDNYILFPISKTKAILLISNFFQIFDPSRRSYAPIMDFNLFTTFKTKKAFLYPKFDKVLGQRKYSFTTLEDEDSTYLNCLLLNEVRNLIAFEDLEKMKETLSVYKNLNYGIGKFSNLEKYLSKKLEN